WWHEVPQGRHPFADRFPADGGTGAARGLRGPHGRFRGSGRAPRGVAEVPGRRLQPHLPAQRRPEPAGVAGDLRPRSVAVTDRIGELLVWNVHCTIFCTNEVGYEDHVVLRVARGMPKRWIRSRMIARKWSLPAQGTSRSSWLHS